MSRDTKSSSSEPAPFLEEWRARRERMRLRSSSSSLVGSRSLDQSHREGDLQPPSQERDKELRGGKPSEAASKVQARGDTESDRNDLTSKAKEKKGSPQKKHRTQIEKRKLREKRRPTGVVNLTSLEDPDENHDEIELNEEHIDKDSPKQEIRKTKGSGQNRADAGPNVPPREGRESDCKTRQRWLEELQKAVRLKRQDNHKLSADLSDKDGTLLVLQKEIKSLKQKMRRAQDENRILKEENQMLLKLMGQLAS
ncbi:PRKC apoptosis WT1 regulator protein-like [Spea bombifrons]|uniref:PRKC apoptosis WT1 regulator protein-like n=1 Tax=Spea bombifrons TaxID=233779 RepID=UPI00234B1E3C|nr:PRKC apoptosis WT1 regulator protein-like [Spea bombifrons]